MYSCHCCLQNTCRCSTINGNNSSCNIIDGKYKCKTDESCICIGPTPFQWKEINKKSSTINKNANKK